MTWVASQLGCTLRFMVLEKGSVGSAEGWKAVSHLSW